MKNRDNYWRRYKIQETLYLGQWHISPLQSRNLGTSHSSPITISCPIIFFWISSTVWNLFPSKVILVWVKARSHRVPNLGFRRAESPGWFDVSPENSAWDMMHEWAHCHDEAASHQLPIATVFWIIWVVSAEECSGLCKIWCRFIALLTQLFWMSRPHSTQAHSTTSTAPTD